MFLNRFFLVFFIGSYAALVSMELPFGDKLMDAVKELDAQEVKHLLRASINDDTTFHFFLAIAQNQKDAVEKSIEGGFKANQRIKDKL